MSENNDYIQLPPLKKDTPSDVVAYMWEYLKVPENSREKVKIFCFISCCCTHDRLSS